jgi:hypothetical protein
MDEDLEVLDFGDLISTSDDEALSNDDVETDVFDESEDDLTDTPEEDTEPEDDGTPADFTLSEFIPADPIDGLSNSEEETNVIEETEDGEVVLTEDEIILNDNLLTIPCVSSVKKGDSVLIALLNGEPTAIGVAGWGDKVETDIAAITEVAEAAKQAADEAKDLASSGGGGGGGSTVSTKYVSDTGGTTTNSFIVGNASGHNVMVAANNSTEGILLRTADKLDASFTASGVTFYDEDETPTASFNKSGAVIGQENETQMIIDKDSLSVVGEGNVSYLNAGLLNGDDGKFTTTGLISGAGVTSAAFPFINVSIDSVVKTNANGETTNLSYGTDYTYNGTDITLVKPLAEGERVNITYSVDWPVPSFTAGIRGEKPGGSPYTVGAYSSVLGQGVAMGYSSFAQGFVVPARTQDGAVVLMYPTAYGNGSHAQGMGSQALGDASYAGGYLSYATGYCSTAHGSGVQAAGKHSAAFGTSTFANGDSSLAIGAYNEGLEDSLFEIGNGYYLPGSSAPSYNSCYSVNNTGDITRRTNGNQMRCYNHRDDISLRRGQTFDESTYLYSEYGYDMNKDGANYFDQVYITAAGRLNRFFGVRSYDENGENAILNAVYMGITADGDRVITLNSAAWLESMMTAAMLYTPSAALNLSKSFTKVPLNSFTEKDPGSLLSKSENGIKLARAGQYLVSASLRYSGVTENDKIYARIYRGTTATNGVAFSNTWATDGYVHITPYLITANAGDTIFLYAQNSTAARGTVPTNVNSWLTVQYLG